MASVDLQAIIDAYVKLLIVQYNDKPRAQATIALLSKQLLANGIYWDVQEAYDIETAVGKQLDVLGKYIGVDRYFVGSVFPDDAFAFTDAFGDELDESKGFIDAFEADPIEGFFLGIEDATAPHQTMDDETYRAILKLKIIQNSINHSQKQIDDALYRFFGLSIFCTDNYDMSMTYFAINESYFNFLQLAAQKDVLPRPMGVQLNILEGTDFFGFMDAFSDDESGQGYIDAFEPTPNPGVFLSYKEITDNIF